ncbi:tRNA uridine-5-carboxymethylaminomethyl(34) synthesis enzyme MnmG [Desulfobacterales bacterium HSG16]|nr:tRNA uridine-5-carboxymethylaminomethyl(34) synthesis enzyme MnmG [Desulfobacterales bacterium HSG16]
MAKITDKSAIQFRTLNTKKGPAVHSSRTQNDKLRYHMAMKSVIECQANLDLKQALVEKLITENGEVKGVVDNTGFSFQSKAVIIATGTFLSGLVHIGTSSFMAGRAGEFASYGLAADLKGLGFQLGRMKTGTPPRLLKSSIDFSAFNRQDEQVEAKPFSFSNESVQYPRVPSYMGHTSDKSHKIVLDNLNKSALYSGNIKGVSARYCPSFEDKAVKFPHRTIHKVILEPEGLDTEEIYASGLGNSLPMEVQIKFVRSVKGLEQAEIMRPAYAIEYDYINPIHLKPTLETGRITNLFMAGQINGTSGYEEAAAQGLWAGINAACKILGMPAFILDRSEAYMGVLMDDLVTRGTTEPYRMFTSRAEYRLMLREDNADMRLVQKGYELRLVNKDFMMKVEEKRKKISAEIGRIKQTVIKPSVIVNDYLTGHDTKPIKDGIHLDRLLKRTQLDYKMVKALSPAPESMSNKVSRQVEIEIKYEGYIRRQLSEIDKFKHMEQVKIPLEFDYKKVYGLSNEITEKLFSIRPSSLGQASRIDGITPVAISVLMVALKAFRRS